MTKSKAFFICFIIPLVLFISIFFNIPSLSPLGGGLFGFLGIPVLIFSLFVPAFMKEEFRKNGLYGLIMSVVFILIIYGIHERGL